MEKLFDKIQLLLFAAALVCIIIAAATFLFGDQNILQKSAYPSMGLWLLFYFIINRMGNNGRPS